MRAECVALKWLLIGALAPALPFCDSLIHRDEVADPETERELLRSIFMGSFLACVSKLPIEISDSERREVFSYVEASFDHEVVWTTSLTLWAALLADDPPDLNESTREATFDLHADRLARTDEPLRIPILAAINMSTRLSMRLLEAYFMEHD